MAPEDKMPKLNWAKWSSAALYGLVLGGFCSIIPVVLWEKVALNQGDEFEVDLLIVSTIVVGSILFVWRSADIASAVCELLIVVLMSSVVTGGVVVVVDSCKYQPVNIFCFLKAFGVALVFALPAMILACGFLWIFSRKFH